MNYRVPRIVEKTLENYSVESKIELEELSKLNLMVSNGRLSERKIYISIDNPKFLEVRIYDLSNLSVNTYSDFNRRIKKLIK